MYVDDYLPEEEQPPRITFDRRLSVGGRTYEFTAFRTGEGPVNLRLAGGEPESEIVTEVSGVIPPDDLPAVTAFLTSSLAGLVATIHGPAARRTSSLASKRQTHPNLGARWTEGEERRLVARHREGATIDDR